jgi:hypothetical protein
MLPVREDMFHLMIHDGGGSSNGALSSVSCVGDNGYVIAHELGHQLNVLHYGAGSAGIMNSKPQYASITQSTDQTSSHRRP